MTKPRTHSSSNTCADIGTDCFGARQESLRLGGRTSIRAVVNFLHDSLGPLNARFDELVRPWASLWASKQVVSRPHVQARQNRGHDSNDAFAALVHQSIIALSPCIRHGAMLISNFKRGRIR